jgi:hypothetical protein
VAPRRFELGPKARTAKEWIDVVAYGGSKIAKGLVPLAVGSIAGVEAFAPALLPAIQMSHDTAMLILAASAGVLVPGLRLTGGNTNG